MTRISIDISDDLHHFLKVHTARKKETIVNFVRQAIFNKIDQDKVPNEETIKALEESRRGIGITKFASKEELYKDLGIE